MYIQAEKKLKCFSDLDGIEKETNSQNASPYLPGYLQQQEALQQLC